MITSRGPCPLADRIARRVVHRHRGSQELFGERIILGEAGVGQAEGGGSGEDWRLAAVLR